MSSAPTGPANILRFLLLACTLMLSACASRLPLPAANPTLSLPLQLHIEREQAGQRQDWLLVMQREDAGIRWSMMDPLGIPLARQRLVDGQWQADGLLPPNPEARELFAALLFALTPEAELPRNYPRARYAIGIRGLAPRWVVTYQTPSDFVMELPKQLNYHVTPISAETAP